MAWMFQKDIQTFTAQRCSGAGCNTRDSLCLLTKTAIWIYTTSTKNGGKVDRPILI